MIDTERAEVDLKTSVRRLRYYINKLKQGTGEREKRLADHFQFELGLLNTEAREAHKVQIYARLDT
jgi:hypothetical protein